LSPPGCGIKNLDGRSLVQGAQEDYVYCAVSEVRRWSRTHQSFIRYRGLQAGSRRRDTSSSRWTCSTRSGRDPHHRPSRWRLESPALSPLSSGSSPICSSWLPLRTLRAHLWRRSLCRRRKKSNNWLITLVAGRISVLSQVGNLLRAARSVGS